MRRFIYLWITVLMLLSAALPAVQAADISLSITCVDHSQPDRAIIHFGYSASETVAGTGYLAPAGNFEGALPPNILEAGQHDDVFVVEVFGPMVWQFVSENVTAELSVDVDTSGPDCDQVGQYGPDGGLKTVSKDVAPGCYEWSIADDYGHWSTVATTCSQQEGDHVFVRLVLGRDNPVTDETRYKVWKVND
jgi:hypothetical protein